MKRLCCSMMASLLLAGLFSFASGAGRAITASGGVRDSVNQNSISEAAVLLAAINPLTFNPNNLANLKYDTLTTGDDGFFEHPMTIDPAATILVYGVQKPGYLMKYGFVPIAGDYVDLGIILLAKTTTAVTNTITLTGTVVDSSTGTPIAGAVVSATGLSKLDTTGNSTVTGADGKFSKQVTIKSEATMRVMLWAVTKTDYKGSAGQVTLEATTTTLNLGTIKLSKSVIIIPPTTDTVTVSGTVIDANSSAGIAGATVAMSGLGIDTAGNTAVTGADGKFSKKVIVTNTSAFRAVAYVVTKTGYVPTAGQAAINSKTIDVGDIPLTAKTGVIANGRTSIASITRANNIQIYSLKGQLLYAGPVVAIDKVLPMHHTPVVVNYRCNNLLINRATVISAK